MFEIQIFYNYCLFVFYLFIDDKDDDDSGNEASIGSEEENRMTVEELLTKAETQKEVFCKLEFFFLILSLFDSISLRQAYRSATMVPRHC